MREAVLGLEKALCPSVVECQDREAGVGELVSRWREEEMGGRTRKGDKI